MFSNGYTTIIAAVSVETAPFRVISILFSLIFALALAYGLFLAGYFLLRKSYRALRRCEKKEEAKNRTKTDENSDR